MNLARHVLVLLSLSALAACATAGGTRATETAPIRVEAVRMTAAGHFIDLRYRVLDPGRANSALGPGVRPLLIDQATGIRMGVPMTAKLGPLRQTQAKQRPDHLYFVMFTNTAGIHAGSRVTAQLGDITVTDLTVE